MSYQPLIGQPGYNRNYSNQTNMDVDNSNDGNNGQFNGQGNNGQGNNGQGNNGQGNNGQNNYQNDDQGNFLMDSNDDDTTKNNIATFERFYTPYNGYNATDTCNPVTARLIIFYNDSSAKLT
jgi:hypothetical protein